MRLVVGLLAIVTSAFSQSVTPYTITEVSREFDAAGKVISESRFLFAVNRDGSIVSVDLDTAVGGVSQILDVVNGRNIVVNPKARSASVIRHRNPPWGHQGNRCAERYVRGDESPDVSINKSAGSILGVDVEMVTFANRDGSSYELYLAPSLGCQGMRAVMRRNGQSLESRSIESLKIGDPDPALFEIPAGYSVKTFPLP
jgi:hypothetical protein